ncbi:MAG TPA: hydrogenase maturation protease [bacterium]
MRKSLIIGIGNPLRRDDGWHVAQQLQDELSSDEVEVMAAHQLLPEFVEKLRDVECAIFIDAQVGDRPGEISQRKVEPSDNPSVSFSHDFDIPTLLAFAKTLYGRVPEAHLFTITGEDFSTGEGFSEVVSKRVDELRQMIIGFIRQ